MSAPAAVIAGYVTVPAGVVMTRADYVPANQSSRHTLEPGRYPVELVTLDGRVPDDTRPYGGGRPYYYRVRVDAVEGTHDYYGRMPARHTVTALGAHAVTLSGYAYELERGYVSVPESGGWRRLEVEALEGVTA